jgi:predicted DNA-binding transcriptional regulator AlpA
MKEMTMNQAVQLVGKTQVCAMLGISDRTLEKLVRSRQFPAPLRLGKRLSWVDSVVQSWLLKAVEPQLNWEPPKRIRKS